MDTSAEMTAVPVENGTRMLPKRAGTRTMIPLSWLDHSVRIEYAGAGGDARQTTATLLDFCPIGLLINIAGAKCLLPYERLVLLELQAD